MEAEKPIKAHHQSAVAFQKENRASKFVHHVFIQCLSRTSHWFRDTSHEEDKDQSPDGIYMEVGGADNTQLKKLHSTLRSGNNCKTD